MKSNGLPFTETAKKALDASVAAAKKLKQTYIGTEHVLLGLLRVPCAAGDILKKNGIYEEKLLELMDKLTYTGTLAAAQKKSPVWSPKAQALKELAADEARRGNMEVIGTEHILMAVFRQDDSMAMRLLRTIGVQDERLLNDLYQSMGIDGMPYMRQVRDAYTGEPQERSGALEDFSRDLTALAAAGKLDPVIGRKAELDRVIRTLSRRSKNNPCLMGEPGVGKTAIVEALAQRLAKGDVPQTIAGKRLLSLDLAAMVAGTKYRGEFEERIEDVISEASADGNVLLFLDEIHTLIGAGGAEGSLDAANILKPALSRGEIQIIGATTVDEYRKHIEKDAALERRFQPIMVEEPSVKETEEILLGLKSKFESHHGIAITGQACKAAAELSERYISDRFLPDKAIDLIDEAAAKLRLGRKASKKSTPETPVLTEDDIAKVVGELTKIPVSKLTESESDRLGRLENQLHKRIISQDEAVSAVARAVRRGRVGLKDPGRPVGSFLLLGPTGVGKTELARTLAQALFGREDALIRLDMSEYMESHSVSKIIGSPPGYVGYDEGGQLSEKIRRNPYCVLLFDEIEKAHPDIFHVFLQILDDGHITDAQGRKIDFKNTIIIMTSNAGAERIVAPKKLGFTGGNSAEADYQKMKSSVMEEVKKLFKPELLNRIDEIIVFRMLEKEDIKKILSLQLSELAARVKAQMGITLRVSAPAREYLMKKGYDPKYGARPLRRAIQTELEDPLATKILSDGASASDTKGRVITAKFDRVENKITF